MPPVPVNPGTTYLGDPVQTLESLRKNANKNRDWRDGLNSFFGNDPMKRPDAIDWKKRFDEGLIENGVVKVTAGDALIGRSQPELQLAYETWRQKNLQRDAVPLNARLRSEGLTPVKIDTDVNRETLLADEQQLNKVIEYRDRLLPMDGGPEAFAALGDNPTPTQILGATSALQAKIDKPGKERAIELHDDTLQNNQRARQNSAANVAINRDTLNLNSVLAKNSQKMDEWRIQDAAAQRRFEQEEATRRAKYDSDNSNADRTLQLQLAEMSSGERRADRDYDRRRDNRKERQMMIMQLMEGLNNLGGIFQ